MRTFLRTFLAATVLVLCVAAAYGTRPEISGPTPDAMQLTEAFEHESTAIRLRHTEALSALRLKTIRQLQKLQDELCRDARLDEAVAVRDRLRAVAGKTAASCNTAIPPDAAEMVEQYERKAAAIETEMQQEVLAAGKRTAEPLQTIHDRLCREAKLDEAMEVRNLIRRLTGVVTDVRCDPGNLHATTADIGKVWYFEVVGTTSGAPYGTKIYTSDSSLAAAAVHSGAIKPGERGVVKVTILPGQSHYDASTCNGITSYAYGAYSVSFQVERTYAVVISPLKSTSASPHAPAPPCCGPPPRG